MLFKSEFNIKDNLEEVRAFSKKTSFTSTKPKTEELSRVMTNNNKGLDQSIKDIFNKFVQDTKTASALSTEDNLMLVMALIRAANHLDQDSLANKQSDALNPNKPLVVKYLMAAETVFSSIPYDKDNIIHKSIRADWCHYAGKAARYAGEPNDVLLNEALDIAKDLAGRNLSIEEDPMGYPARIPTYTNPIISNLIKAKAYETALSLATLVRDDVQKNMMPDGDGFDYFQAEAKIAEIIQENKNADEASIVGAIGNARIVRALAEKKGFYKVPYWNLLKNEMLLYCRIDGEEEARLLANLILDNKINTNVKTYHIEAAEKVIQQYESAPVKGF